VAGTDATAAPARAAVASTCLNVFIHQQTISRPSRHQDQRLPTR
jgi:hypothetical protein